MPAVFDVSFDRPESLTKVRLTQQITDLKAELDQVQDTKAATDGMSWSLGTRN